MNPQQDPLAGLRDIHLPEPVAFWPRASGWWIALAVIVAVAVSAELLRRRRLASLRSAALRELDELEQDWQRSSDPSSLAYGLSTLLRRVALARYPRTEVAALAGGDWSAFLAREGGKRQELASVASEMGEVLYGPPRAHVNEEEGAGWIAAVRTWIRRKA